MNSENERQPMRINLSQLQASTEALYNELRFIRGGEMNGGGNREDLRRLAYLSAVTEFLEVVFPDILSEGLCAPGKRMADDLMESLQRECHPTNGRPRVPPAEAAVRSAALAGVDLLKGMGMGPEDARKFVADALTSLGRPTTNGQVKDLDEWAERQPRPKEMQAGRLSPEGDRLMLLDAMEDAVRRGGDRKEVVRNTLGLMLRRRGTGPISE